MTMQGGSNWISLFLCGGIAVVLSWATSGCFFGNYQSPQPNPDQTSGYYVTLPQSLTFFATTQSGTQTKSADLSLIPSDVGQYLTNPVMVIMQSLSTGSAALTSPALAAANSGNIPYLPINIATPAANDSPLSYSQTSAPGTFWTDPNCQSTFDLVESGTLTQTTAVMPPAGNTLPLKGELQLTLRLVTQLTGNCGPTLQTIADCYQDATQCGGTTSDQNQQIQTQVQTLFGPYIESEALALADLPTLSEYAFEVSYQ